MCDSVSGLNINQQAGQSLLEKGEGSTGATGRACLAYIERHRPAFFMIENVKFLASDPCLPGKVSDADTIILWSNEQGYHVVTSVLDSLEYGYPQALLAITYRQPHLSKHISATTS